MRRENDHAEQTSVSSVSSDRAVWERPAFRRMDAADAQHFTKKNVPGELHHFATS